MLKSKDRMRMRNCRAAWAIALLTLFCCNGFIAAAAQEKLPAGKELAGLLERMQVKRAANSKLAMQYTSEELYHNLNFDKHGKTTVDESAKFENLFVGGLPYRRQTAKNGKPLTGKDAEKEEQRYEKAIKDRKAMTMATKRLSLHRTFNIAMPINYLTKLFDNRVVRTETLDGREMLVVESTPRQDVQPTSNEEKQAMSWKQYAWIDREDLYPAKIVWEKLNAEEHLLKGTIDTLVFERRKDTASDGTVRGVWLQTSFRGEFRMKIMLMTFRGTTEQSWSNFKKFQVDVRLLEDTMQEVEEGTTPKK